MPLLEVKIPPMGESITSGILASWHVKDGDTVKKDQPLFELETDKITSEAAAEAAGRIILKAEAGAEVKIGQVVAVIETSGGGAPAAAPAIAAAPAAPAKEPAPAPKPAAAPASGADGATQSPAVRRIASETGLDPSSLQGSGKAGRVTKGDMLAAASATDPTRTPVTTAPDEGAAPKAASAPPPVPATPAAAPAPVPAPPPGGRQTRRKLSPLRQRIAQRLVSAQREAAMLTTFNEVDMSAVMGLRARYQEDFVKRNGVKLGFMSFFAKAAVQALQAVPAVNAQMDGEFLVENHYYDIGVAVSTEKGLMVPVIRDCDRLGMADIEKAIGDAAKRAREGKITLADLEGGVFTITNGGIFGSMLSTPIINPPQSAILGLHAITERPMAVGGQVVIRPMMYLALSYDHRIVDGREAVTFLVRVKQAIEDPARLLLSV
jgi:2-oxoglutarate dehydrogenase E2 component (dihydrolipoamide succinyltransferase)